MHPDEDTGDEAMDEDEVGDENDNTDTCDVVERSADSTDPGVAVADLIVPPIALALSNKREHVLFSRLFHFQRRVFP